MSDTLEQVFDEFANATEATVLRLIEEVRTLRTEVETLRANPPVGEPGPQGPAGERGADGAQGPVGPEGRPGERGEQGPIGERGADGIAGRDGAIGPQGERGERGADGIATREELEAIVEERFADLQVRSLADWYQGVFRADTDYQRGQLVQWDGSLFLAQKPTRSTPLDGPDWRLITKKGRDGRDRR